MRRRRHRPHLRKVVVSARRFPADRPRRRRQRRRLRGRGDQRSSRQWALLVGVRWNGRRPSRRRFEEVRRRRGDDGLRIDPRRLRRRRRGCAVRRAKRVDLVADHRRRCSVRCGLALRNRPPGRRVVFPGDRRSLREGDRDLVRRWHLRGRERRCGVARRGPARRRTTLEERLELADRTERPRGGAGPAEEIAPRDLVGEDRPLELAERQERELLAARRLDEPAIARGVLTRGLLAANLELMAARRAANGRSTPADERVVELILGFAPLALNVHRLVACGASHAGKNLPLSCPCLARPGARRARSRACSSKADINTRVPSVSNRVLHATAPRRGGRGGANRAARSSAPASPPSPALSPPDRPPPARLEPSSMSRGTRPGPPGHLPVPTGPATAADRVAVNGGAQRSPPATGSGQDPEGLER